MKSKTLKKIISGVALLGLIISPPSLVLAQTVSTSTPPAEPVATSTLVTAIGIVAPVQDTSSSQVTIPSNALESTINPNLDLGSTTPPVDTATSTPPSSATTTIKIIPKIDAGLSGEVKDIVDHAFDPNPLLDEPTVESQQADVVSTVDAVNLTPKSEFSFRIGAGKIAAKAHIKSTSKNKSSNQTPSTVMVNTDLNTTLDSDAGVLTLSGSCASKYYVVLLYKNADDYDLNPRSYLINKAFPCVNSSYSYSISSLPESLKNGTYYILVAEQSDEGAWTPITSLTPIDINKNN